jgi:Leucine-rich repeat (LRR) protein
MDGAVLDNKSRRRWLRYGLRSALILVTIVAIAATWLGSHVRRCHREIRALERLLTANANTRMDVGYSNPFAINKTDAPDGGWGRTAENFIGGPKWLTRVLGVDIFRTVTGLSYYGVPGSAFHYGRSDQWMIHVTSREYATKIGEQDIRSFAQLSNLRSLYLHAIPIADNGLAEFQQLKDLRSLQLQATAITDAGPSVLAELPELQELNLDSSDVTDAGMKSIAACKKLKKLNLSRTIVTKEGIALIKAQLPICEITHGTLNDDLSP